MKSVKVQGRVVTVGDALFANEFAAKTGLCPAGTKARVYHIMRDEDQGILIGVESSKQIAGWHDLDGRLKRNNTGYWFHKSSLSARFNFTDEQFVVKESYLYKKKDLKGMVCKRVPMRTMSGVEFVQMDEDIGGGSADGMGKTGHCIPIQSKILEPYKPPKKKKGKERDNVW